jgi:nucleoside-diphosphate-sugar epimerase
VKRIYLIGGNGRLGRALVGEYASAEVVALDRAVYQSWSREGAEADVARYFGRQETDAVIFVTSGLLDPRLPPDMLLGVNYLLPKNVIAAVTPLPMRVVTFGTAMEALPQATNPYIESKRRLSEYVDNVAQKGGAALHLQIHTLYGIGEPTSFMFLGQIVGAIRRNGEFNMTSGRQLREYHHLADEVRAIRWLAGSPLRGTVGLSHGNPVTLSSIAESVFESLGKRNLLKLGVLPDPAEENYKKTFEPVPLPATIRFRETIPAIVDYMKSCLSKDSEQGKEFSR